jgi:lipopolysaccharide transport system permease protein
MEIRPRNTLAKFGLPQVWEYRHLLHFFVLRALRGRYRPTTLGYGWILLRPALIGLVYVLVFEFLFRIRSANVPFAVFAVTGVLIYLFFAGAVSEIAASLLSSSSTMSKVYYPRLIIPLTALLTNLLDLIAGSVLIIALMAVYLVAPSWNIWLAPLFLGGFTLWTFAIGLTLAAISVERRDIMMLVPVAMRVLIYSMPAVYPASLVPEDVLPFYYLNPMAVFLQGFRWAAFADTLPPMWSIALASVLGWALLIYGLYLFNRAQITMVDKL